MKGAVAVLAIIILAASSLFAQVHIRENATITPEKPKKVEDGGSNNHVLSFTLSLQYQSDIAIIVVSGPNYFNVFSSVGSVSGEIQSPIAGNYYFTPCISGYQQEYHSFDDYNCFDIYFDGNNVWGPCGSGEEGSYNTWTVMRDLSIDYPTPYSSKFDFSFPSGQPPLFHGGASEMAVTKVYDSSRTCWFSNTDPLTLTIMSGGQYVSFHGLDSQTGTDVGLGNTVTTVGDSISEF